MEMFILGAIVGGLVVWGYNKYLNSPLTFDEAIVKVEQEAVKVEEKIVEKVRRPRKKAGIDSTSPQ
jgi:hypothetical protein